MKGSAELTSVSATRRILKPLLVVLPFLAIGRFQNLRKKRMVVAQLCLFIVLMFLSLMAISKGIICFIGADIPLRSKDVAIYVSFTLQSCMVCIVHVATVVYSPSRLQKLIDECDRLRRDPVFHVSNEKLRRNTIIYVVGAAFLLVGFTTFTSVLGVSVQEKYICLQSPVNTDSKWHPFHVYVLPFMLFLYFGQKMYGHAFVFVLCQIAKKEFRSCDQELKKMSNATPSSQAIEKIRRRYFDICKMAELVDDVVNPLSSAIIIISFITVCLYVHYVMYGEIIDLASKVTYAILIFLTALEVVIVMAQNISLQETSKQCLDSLRLLDGTKLNQLTVGLVNMFIENIKSVDVGITFMKLFVLDKGAMVGIFGSIISYVIVVAQFQPN